MTDDRAEQEVRRSPVEPVKALTVRQPWATLLCDPTLPKWIETRSRRTNIRGRIGIIAGKRRPPYMRIADRYTVEKFYDAVNHVEACYCDPEEVGPACGRRSQSRPVLVAPGPRVIANLPLGYLIGTVDLYDCVPILDAEDPDDPCGEMASAFIASQGSVTPPDSAWFYDDGSDDIGVGVSDQIPYGDFTPGGWAWLTRDAVLLDEPIPMRGSLGWQTVDFPLPKKTESP